MKPFTPIKPPPRHEALRKAKFVSDHATLDMPLGALLLSLAEAVLLLAEECEALNRSKAEDSHGH